MEHNWMKMMKQTKGQLLCGRGQAHGFGKLTFSEEDINFKIINHWRNQSLLNTFK
jgi:hypothetical protein